MRPPVADESRRGCTVLPDMIGPGRGRVHGGSFPCRGRAGRLDRCRPPPRSVLRVRPPRARRVGGVPTGVGRAGGAGLDPGGAAGRPAASAGGADAARGRDLGAAVACCAGQDAAGARADRGGRGVRDAGRVHVLGRAARVRLPAARRPAFVPPGHGLVYLAALALGRTALVRRHAARGGGRRRSSSAARTRRGGSARWRPGRTCWARSGSCCLLGFLRSGRSRAAVRRRVRRRHVPRAGRHLAAASGPGQPHDPTGLVAMGNPPSGAAGGYGWFDLAAVLPRPRCSLRCPGRVRGWRRGRRRRPADAEAEHREHVVVQQPVAW